MARNPDTLIGRKIYYPGTHGLMLLDGKGPPKVLHEPVEVPNLPPGDWRITLFRGRVIIADRLGGKPLMTWDGEKWETVAPGEAQCSVVPELTDEEKSEMYYYSNGCHSHLYGDPEINNEED